MGKKEKPEKKGKPLDRMTATELRKYALDLGNITGVHGMNKEELLAAIKEAKGIKEEGKQAAKTINVRELKQKLQTLRDRKLAAQEAGESRTQINQIGRASCRERV